MKEDTQLSVKFHIISPRSGFSSPGVVKIQADVRWLPVELWRNASEHCNRPQQSRRRQIIARPFSSQHRPSCCGLSPPIADTPNGQEPGSQSSRLAMQKLHTRCVARFLRSIVPYSRGLSKWAGVCQGPDEDVVFVEVSHTLLCLVQEFMMCTGIGGEKLIIKGLEVAATK